MNDKQLIRVEDLYSDSVAMRKQTQLNQLLNNAPKETWVKDHPYVPGYKYIPVERLEYLLTAIFTRWWVEVKDVKLVANSVVVTVRLFVIDPTTGSEMWNDGIGASPIQTDKGAGAIEFNSMKAAAIQMAAPAAESYAFKDAAEKFGKIFGKDLNRKSGMNYADVLAGRLSYLDDNEDITDRQKMYIESLIRSSTLDEEQKVDIENKVNGYCKAFEAENIIQNLKDNQQHPVFDRAAPSQTEIKETIKQQTK